MSMGFNPFEGGSSEGSFPFSNTENSNSNTQSGGFDPFGSTAQNSGSDPFASSGDDLFGGGSTPSNTNMPPDPFASAEVSGDDLFGGSDTPTAPVGNNSGKEPLELKAGKVGFKTVGILILLGGVIIALILFIISKIKVTDNPDQKPLTVTTTPNMVTEAPAPRDDYFECYIFDPADFDLDFSGEELTAKARVISKDMIKIDDSTSDIVQLMCRISLAADLGVNKVQLHYFIAKDVWDSLVEGQNLTIHYYVPDTKYAVISSITAD